MMIFIVPLTLIEIKIDNRTMESILQYLKRMLLA